MATFDIPTSLVVRGYGARLPETGYYEMFVDNDTERGDMTEITVFRTHADGSVEPLFIGTLEEMPIEGVEKGATIRLDKAKEFPKFDLEQLKFERAFLSTCANGHDVLNFFEGWSGRSEIKKLVNWYINLMEEMK